MLPRTSVGKESLLPQLRWARPRALRAQTASEAAGSGVRRLGGTAAMRSVLKYFWASLAPFWAFQDAWNDVLAISAPKAAPLLTALTERRNADSEIYLGWRGHWRGLPSYHQEACRTAAKELRSRARFREHHNTRLRQESSRVFRWSWLRCKLQAWNWW